MRAFLLGKYASNVSLASSICTVQVPLSLEAIYGGGVFFFCSLLSLFAPKAVVLSLAAFVFYCRYRELSTKRREAFLT